MVAPPKQVHRSTVIGRIASVFALLIWGAIAFTFAGTLFLVIAGLREYRFRCG